MNLQSKFAQFSQKKTEGRCKTLQTLPCELQIDSHQYNSLFAQHNHCTSIKACEPVNTCSSPTFANSELLSLSQYRLNHKDKENLDDNTNWKQEARMLKGANNKLTESNKEVEKELMDLKEAFKLVKEEFKRKPENTTLMNFLSKLSNSSESKDSLDIYLQLLSFTDRIKKDQQVISEITLDLENGKKDLEISAIRYRELESNNLKLSQEVQHLTKVSQEWKQKLSKKQVEYQELKLLKEQVDKQRQNASKKISGLEGELKEVKNSVSEFQKDHQSSFLELEKYKEQNQKCKEQIERLSKQNETLKREKEQFKELFNNQKRMVETEQEEIKEVKDHNFNLERQVAKGIADLDALKRKSDREITSAQQTIRSLETEINDMRDTFQAQKEQREINEERSSSQMANYKKIEQQLCQLKQQKLSLQRQIFSKDQEIEDLKRKVSSTQISQQNMMKDLEELQEKLDLFEREERSIENMEQIKNYEIELKEEVIRKLIGFAPNESKDVLEEYLIIIEELVSSENQSEARKNKVLVQVDHTILAHKDKIKHLEEVSKKYNDLKYEHQLLKKSVANETRRTEVSLETNRRCKINKYFA